MKNTTLCYLEQNGCYLMLHRVKKQQDENAGKWIGVGGKFEEGESPDECVRREVQEETGLVLDEARPRGLVTFVSDEWGTEYMHLFTSSRFSGSLHPCDEGELAWVPVDRVPALELWEGDRLFLDLLTRDTPFFLLKLVYEGDVLRTAVLNGNKIL